MHPEWFFTQIDGKRVGPFTPQQLTYIASSGKLTPDGRYFPETSGEEAAIAQSLKMVAPSPKRPH